LASRAAAGYLLMARGRKVLFYKYNFVIPPPIPITSSPLPPVPVDHYENFPVASWLLPRRLRKPIETIYAFARTADDFADEGSLSNPERLALLDGYDHELDLIDANQASVSPLFIGLAATISEHRLPVQLFRDLLLAFKQDVTKTRYADFEELIDYCRHSANPIGRLLLHLNKQITPQHLAWSDAICTALQLINHWQDVAIDWRKNDNGRVYLPQDDLARFGLGETDIANQTRAPAWRELMAFQCARTRELMKFGAPLGKALSGRMGAELRVIIAGGCAILDKIDAVDGDVFRHRPKLSRLDWLKIGPRAIASL
jgi:squalene synthase HpnC